jgi:hypothetical protein
LTWETSAFSNSSLAQIPEFRRLQLPGDMVDEDSDEVADGLATD